MAGKLSGRNLRNLVLLALAVPLLVYAFSTGPIPGVTGGFGEPTCNQAGCHTGTAVNGGPGGVTISTPQSYTSGGTFPIIVTVSDPNQQRWGFELSARTQNGQQAGTLLPGSDGFTQVIAQGGIQYIEHTLAGTRLGTAGGASFNFSWRAPDASAGPVVFNVAANAANGDFTHDGDRIYTKSATVQPASGPTFSNTYYFPHLALGGGWQTAITYSNYSPQTVTCATTFYSDLGGPLSVSFGGAAASSRTDTLAPGGVVHTESTADLNAAEVRGWARTQCSGPIKASLLFRSYQQGKPTGEAGVNAMTALATKFVTFAAKQTGGVATGVAYANPSTQTAQITFTALSATGEKLASKSIPLLPGAHSSDLLDSLLGLSNFTGSIQIVSTVPIVSLSLNFEAFPSFSSLPSGELDDSTPLAAGDGSPGSGSPGPSTTYYFPHLALGGGWQTTITDSNYSPQTVTCATTFYAESGGPLFVSFGGAAASSRTDTLAPGGVVHTESTADLNAAEVRGWARTQCSGPIKASLLFRSYQQGKPTGEAGVNAMTALATKFVTFAAKQTGGVATGVAYANPSTQTAQITFTALSATGEKLASKSIPLLPGAHRSDLLDSLLGLSNFTGSIQIVSTVPIVSLSLNFEAFPSFSSLPSGELDDSTPLAAGTDPSQPPPPEPPPPDPYGY